MTALTAWTFLSADAVRAAEARVGALSAQGLVVVNDGAILSWPATRGQPRTRELESIALTAAVGLAFWGVLFGDLFFTPRLDALLTSQSVAPGSALRGIGISDEFAHEVRQRVTAGTSALFLLTASPSPHALDAALAGLQPRRVQARLNERQNLVLRAIFTG